MEQLNKVELRGIVGAARTSELGGKKLVRMSVATNLAYRDKDGCAVIETTWHNVVAFEGDGVCHVDSIAKGDKICVSGRIRNQRYTTQDGNEVTTSEIYACKVSKIESDEPLQYQF